MARAKTLTSATGNSAAGPRRRVPQGYGTGRRNGFTLLELLVALAIAGMVLAISVPSSMRFYESMQYRSAVREVVSVLSSARHTAVGSGRTQDVTIDPKTAQLQLEQRVERLPAGLNIVVHAAHELNRGDVGVIRFYPEGGSSGGGVDIENPAGGGVRITVDWLKGTVSQERYALE